MTDNEFNQSRKKTQERKVGNANSLQKVYRRTLKSILNKRLIKHKAQIDIARLCEPYRR